MLAEERVVFDCPKCGVRHDGPLTIEVDSEAMGWEVDMFHTMSAFVRQTMTTSACSDVFVTRSITDEPTYEMSLISFDDDRPTQLHIVPRHEGDNDDGAA